MDLVRAVIKLEVPEYQIGQPVTIYFKDTMQKFGICDKEQEKKLIKLHKKHTFTFRRNDIFSMWRVYEKICETLMDERKLVISRTDDHEKVNFVWEIREDDTD